MMDKNHIERVLKVNGLSSAASDSEIREILLGAHYRESEVDSAISILRNNLSAESAQVGSTHKIFNSDSVLSSGEISKLLGIDVRVSEIGDTPKKNSSTMGFLGHMLIWLIASMVAVFGVVVAMYTLDFGIFHPTAAFMFYDVW